MNICCLDKDQRFHELRVALITELQMTGPCIIGVFLAIYQTGLYERPQNLAGHHRVCGAKLRQLLLRNETLAFVLLQPTKTSKKYKLHMCQAQRR